MNDGKLSQDEIDALLNGTGDEGEEQSADISSEEILSVVERDAIGEIGNISFGSSATSLSTLLNQKVDITTPDVELIQKKDIDNQLNFEPVTVQVNYIEGLTGRNVFVIKATDAAIIADIMLGNDGTNPDEEITEMHVSAVQEAMNQMMGAAATSMSTIFNKRVDISPPTILKGDADEEAPMERFDEDYYVKVSFKLMVGDLIDSNMMQLIPIEFAKDMVDNLLNGSPETATADTNEPAQETPQQQSSPEQPQQQSDSAETGQPQQQAQQPAQALSGTMSQQQSSQPQYLGNQGQAGGQVQQATFSSFDQTQQPAAEHRNLDMLLDIPLKVTVELGRTKKTVRDILDLSQGSIVELDKLAGEPVDILVNDKLVAEGEVVVIEENFGVRVTDIISRADRLMKLK